MKRWVIIVGMVTLFIAAILFYPIIKTRNYITDWYSKNIHGIKSVYVMPNGFAQSRYYGGGSRLVYIKFDTKVTLGNGVSYNDNYYYCIYASQDLGGYKIIGRIHQK
jgi:hypothetical protein